MHSKLVSVAALYALVGLATAIPHGTFIKRMPQDYGAPAADYGAGGDDSGSDGLQGWEKDVLDMHNSERSQCGQTPLKWSTELAAKSDENASKCVFEHSNDGESGAGENIAEGTIGAYGGGELCKMWADEKNGGGEDGHYTQMVWKDTEEVGCSMRECGGNNYLVCQYYPAGNVQGQEGSNVCSGGGPSNPGQKFNGGGSGGKSPVGGGRGKPTGGHGKPSGGQGKPSGGHGKPSGGDHGKPSGGDHGKPTRPSKPDYGNASPIQKPTKKPEGHDNESWNDWFKKKFGKGEKKPQKPEEPCDDDNDKKGGHRFAPSKKPSDDNDHKFYGKKQSDDDDSHKFYGKKQSDDDSKVFYGNKKNSGDDDSKHGGWGGDRDSGKSHGGKKGGKDEPCDD